MERAVTVESTGSTVGSNDAWTVQRIIDWTVEHLQKHGSDTPRLDTEILLAHARGCQRIELYTHFEDPLTDAERAVMRELVQRRANSEPVAYLVGHREFFGIEFAVTNDVLIPRPDTETLVLEALALAKPHDGCRVLDLGTGSGCIAISIALNCEACHVTATDISNAALDVARQNAERHQVDDRIQFLPGDLFAALNSDQRFDIVASNPPYVTVAELETLQPDVRLHEPRLALDGGADGLDVIHKFIAQSPERLATNGYLLIEIAAEQADPVCDLLSANPAFVDVEVLKDLAGRSRVVKAHKSS